MVFAVAGVVEFFDVGAVVGGHGFVCGRFVAGAEDVVGFAEGGVGIAALLAVEAAGVGLVGVVCLAGLAIGVVESVACDSGGAVGLLVGFLAVFFFAGVEGFEAGFAVFGGAEGGAATEFLVGFHGFGGAFEATASAGIPFGALHAMFEGAVFAGCGLGIFVAAGARDEE